MHEIQAIAAPQVTAEKSALMVTPAVAHFEADNSAANETLALRAKAGDFPALHQLWQQTHRLLYLLYLKRYNAFRERAQAATIRMEI